MLCQVWRIKQPSYYFVAIQESFPPLDWPWQMSCMKPKSHVPVFMAKVLILSATSLASTGVAAFSNAIILGDPGAVRRGEGT